MTTKSVVGIALVCTALGFGLGHFGGASLSDTEQRQLVAEDLSADVEQARSALARMRKENRSLATLNLHLRQQVDELRSSAATAQAEIDELVTEATQAHGKVTASVLAGSLRENAAIATADWSAIAAALENYHELQVAMVRRQGAGLSAAEFEDKLEESATGIRRALAGLTAALIDAVPTHSPGNGEFTHPLVLANTLGALLEHEGTPLTTLQKEAIADAVEDFEAEYEATQEWYSDATPRLSKVVDELRLKQHAMSQLWNGLSDEQVAALASVDEADRLGVAICSPLLIASGKVRDFDNAVAAHSGIRHFAAKRYGLSTGQIAALNPAFDEWLRQTQLVEASPDEDSTLPPRIDRVVAAGEAHAHLLEAIVETVQLDDETAERLLDDATWIVPRIGQ